MKRSVEERIRDVRCLLAAAEAVFQDRQRIAPAIAAATGLSPAGVELGFASLERDATDEALRSLVARAGDAPRVHVILSANVFVAPLRALAVARAAAPRVTVRPSSRDPALTHALVAAVAAAGDAAVGLVDERDFVASGALEAGEIHVYGRDETIAVVRSRAADSRHVTVRGHGAGLGLAVVTHGIDVDVAAELLAQDVVPFDQRGCLSPRLAIVQGDAARALAFARTLHERLGAWTVRVPRGSLTPEERAESRRWRDTLAFAGDVFDGDGHAVAVAPPGAPWWLPPAGRHVQVIAQSELADLAARVAPIAPFVVTVATDDAPRVLAALPALAVARISPLGRVQHPELDGPVDLRNQERTPMWPV